MAVEDFTQDKKDMLKDLIYRLCDIILTFKDCLDEKDFEEYIRGLSDEQKKLLNSLKDDASKEYVLELVKDRIYLYIDRCRNGEQGEGSPFAFDVGNGVKKHKENFFNIYRNENSGAETPVAFVDTFRYIGEMCEHYRIFERFNKIVSIDSNSDAIDVIKKDASATVKKTKEDVEKIVNDSKDKIEKNAEKTLQDIKNNLKNELLNINKHISETSVTILGMFSGIVLTVVAGLFYSSSVIQNVNTANFYRLVSISALVGFVCFNLLYIMFAFIERFRNPNTKKGFPALFLLVNIILFITMVVFSILQCIFE